MRKSKKKKRRKGREWQPETGHKSKSKDSESTKLTNEKSSGANNGR